MPQPDLASSACTPGIAQLAATLHGRFWADHALDCQALTGTPVTRAEAAMLDDLAEIQAALDAGGCGSVCPTCEGECMVPACSDLACDCQLDPPCRETACPTCGGIGTI